MRKKIIAANWKMNMTVAETVSYLESFRTNVEAVNGVEIVIAPPDWRALAECAAGYRA